MKILEKKKNQDFIILNISDPHLADSEYHDDGKRLSVFLRTLKELTEMEQPDLITVSGDIAWSENYTAYRRFSEIMQENGIPWAPVWGNHDNEKEPETNILAGQILCHHSPLCLYEPGEFPEDGQGNYTVGICEAGKPVFALLMRDSHDREYLNGDQVWCKLREPQKVHLLQECVRLKNEGYREGMLVLHIPIHAYKNSFLKAFSGICDPKAVPIQESSDPKYWNEGFRDSFGVYYEGIGNYPVDDGVLEVLKESGFIRTVVAGHSHKDNFCVSCEGIRLTFSLKTGCGSYWSSKLSGGTVFTVGENGMKDIRHHYVDVSDML